MRGRDKFKKIKPIISLLCAMIKIFPRKIRTKQFYRTRYKKGMLGILKRYIYLKSIAISCGDNVSIHEGVFLLNPEQFTCGDNVSIHPMCYLDATGGIDIGNDVSIAHGVTIMSTTHSYDNSKVCIKDQEVIRKKTIICDNVWIGAKATIVAGNTIRSGCVIGANAVVISECDENSVMLGIPARKVKVRE